MLKPKNATKSATVARMLGRERGATIAELVKATGWKEHSARAFLARVRKTQKVLKEERPDGATTYRLVATELKQAPEAGVKA